MEGASDKKTYGCDDCSSGGNGNGEDEQECQLLRCFHSPISTQFSDCSLIPHIEFVCFFLCTCKIKSSYHNHGHTMFVLIQ